MLYQEKSSGKDGGADVAEKESALEEAGAMDAVLVNTHQVRFCFSFASPFLNGLLWYFLPFIATTKLLYLFIDDGILKRSLFLFPPCSSTNGLQNWSRL